MSKAQEVSETEALATNNNNGSTKTPSVQPLTGSFYKARTSKTVVLLVGLVIMGMSFSLLGSTFVDLLDFFDCDARSITLVMPISSAGLIAASMMAIFRLNRLSVEVSMIISIIALALVIILWTAVRSIYWFLGLSIFQGYFACLLLCEMQPYFLQLWANHKLQKPLLLAIHFFMTLGLALGPFAVIPFLADRTISAHHVPASSNQLSETVTAEMFYGNTSEQFSTPDSMNVTRREYTGNVRAAFIFMGLPILAPGILYMIICIKSGASFWRNTQDKAQHHDGSAVKSNSKLSKFDLKLLIFIALVFFMFNAVAELVPLSFLTLFVSKLLGWKPPQSTLINSAYNGFLCVGRLLVIPFSMYLKPRTILLLNLSTVLSASSFLLLSQVHNAIVWIGVSLLGLGISTVFGTMLLWLSEAMKVTDRLMAAIIISNSVGIVIGPAITGQLFVKVSPMAMTLVVFTASIATTTIYVILRILERRRATSRQIEQEENGMKK